MRIPTALALSLVLALPAAAEAPDGPAVEAALSAAADTVAAGYERVATSAEALVTATDALCADPSEAALTGARDAFADAVLAWSRVEPIRFGPILSDNAAERMHFFPDRRGIGLRQVQAALAETDPAVTDPATLAGRSVALQGLGTAEYLLHGTEAGTLATPEGAFRCDFAAAVAARLAATGQEVADAWADPRGIARRFAHPAPDHADFQSVDDALRTLVGVFTNGMEGIHDGRVAPYLEDGADMTGPRGAAWTRSGLSGPAIEANLAGLRDLFEGARIESLNAGDHAPLWDEIAFEFDNVLALMGAFTADPPPPEAERRDLIGAVWLATGTLRDTFGGRMAPALGQSAAFSVTDGD